MAAKVEKSSTKYPQLKFEHRVYRQMQAHNGFPRTHWIGEAVLGLQSSRNEKHRVLLMDRLGESLEALYTSCNRKFGVKTVCMIGIQIVNRIQSLHGEGYLHRDIKPDNFLVGAGDKNGKDGSVIHMIDMGLAKAYRTANGDHIPMKTGKRLTGTPRYASINTHNGLEQSRRDDLESLCYILIYFLRGRLPWQGMQGSTKKDKYDQIRRKKIEMTPDKLCADQPEEFKNFLNYVRKLEFHAEPDYKFLKKLLQLCCQRVDMRKIDWRFAWQKDTKNELVGKKRQASKNRTSQREKNESLGSVHTNTISVVCLSGPPHGGENLAITGASKSPWKKFEPSSPTMSDRNEVKRENFGNINMAKEAYAKLERAYHTLKKERDELKRKCYEFEVLNQQLTRDNQQLEKDVEALRRGRKRKRDEESPVCGKRPLLGADLKSPIHIE